MINNKLLVALAAIGSIALSTPALSMSSPAGVYLGGQLGWGNTDYDIDRTALHPSINAGEDGFAGRGYVGFQFNRFLGLETGLAAFTKTDLPSHFGDIKTLQWDLLAKVGTPFGDSGFRGDVKFGAAQIFTDYDASEDGLIAGFHDSSRSVTRPIAGASISYDFCSNVAMDVSYLHGFGDLHGHDRHFTPNTDLVTLGVSVLLPL